MVTRLQNEIKRQTSVKQASEELVSRLKQELRVTQELDVSTSDLIRDADRQTKGEDCMLGESEEEDNPCDRSKTNNNHSGNKESERVEETGSNAENRDEIEATETDGKRTGRACIEPVEATETEGEQASSTPIEPVEPTETDGE